jgi:hypothetical protein
VVRVPRTGHHLQWFDHRGSDDSTAHRISAHGRCDAEDAESQLSAETVTSDSGPISPPTLTCSPARQRDTSFDYRPRSPASYPMNSTGGVRDRPHRGPFHQGRASNKSRPRQNRITPRSAVRSNKSCNPAAIESALNAIAIRVRGVRTSTKLLRLVVVHHDDRGGAIGDLRHEPAVIVPSAGTPTAGRPATRQWAILHRVFQERGGAWTWRQQHVYS